MRVYELMVIFDSAVADTDIGGHVEQITATIENEGGKVAKSDNWGRRRFAYEIDHKWEGTYVVAEIVTEAADLSTLDRQLRLADEVVRHKILRLPDDEANRRGLLGVAPSSADAE
ncbi:MAG: 30S ribosomal protein S6 [Acidobacteria bacterium]|nr:30S ribosomal protein S6 [Acidobacteriota bacterium]